MKSILTIVKSNRAKKAKRSTIILNNEETSEKLITTDSERNEVQSSKINNPKRTLRLINRRKTQKLKTKKPEGDLNDLFFYFLKASGKIIEFEPELSKAHKKNENFEDESLDMVGVKKININQIFYQDIFLSLTKGSKQWNNFSFPENIYKVLYNKSRMKQKEIMSYCIKNNQNYELTIASYEKIYTAPIAKHNWQVSPRLALANYIKFINEANKAKNANKAIIQINKQKFKDIVVKVDNKGQGKTLFFIGKFFNIYIDDYISTKKNDNRFNSGEKLSKEIVYEYKDLLPKIKLKKKKNFMTLNKSKNFNNPLTSRTSDFERNYTETSRRRKTDDLIRINENQKNDLMGNFRKYKLLGNKDLIMFQNFKTPKLKLTETNTNNNKRDKSLSPKKIFPKKILNFFSSNKDFYY